MIGGFIKSSRFAALAGAGVIAGSMAISPAQAADLGGDCCADLEERVATLEATTVRKGNRAVSLSVSGWVNTGVFIWDDGIDSDAYVVTDNGTTLSSRITFAGSVGINSDWTAGFAVTIEPQSATPVLAINQLDDDSTSNGQNGVPNGSLGLLESYLWVQSKTWGKLSVGLQSQATDNISVVDTLIVDTGSTAWVSPNPVFRGQGMFLRSNTGGGYNSGFEVGGGIATAGTGKAVLTDPTLASTVVAAVLGATHSIPIQTNLSWGDFLQCHSIAGGIGQDCNGLLTDSVRIDLPTIAGFTVSASWGEDDFYDVAVRYAGNFGDVRVGASFGYSRTKDDTIFGDVVFSGAGTIASNDTELFQASVAAMHVPTGIFGAYSYAVENVTLYPLGVAQPAGLPDPDSHAFKVGIKQKINSLGATAVVFDMGIFNDQFSPLLALNGFTGSEVTTYGVGLVQWIDAAAMHMYVKWKHWELETQGGAVAQALNTTVEDMDTIALGAIIYF